MQKYSYQALYVHFVWDEFLSKVLEMWGRLEGRNSFWHKIQEWEMEWKWFKTHDFIFHELWR